MSEVAVGVYFIRWPKNQLALINMGWLTTSSSSGKTPPIPFPLCVFRFHLTFNVPLSQHGHICGTFIVFPTIHQEMGLKHGHSCPTREMRSGLQVHVCGFSWNQPHVLTYLPTFFCFVITQYYTNLTSSRFKLLKCAVCFPLCTLMSLFLSVKMEIMAVFFINNAKRWLPLYRCLLFVQIVWGQDCPVSTAAPLPWTEKEAPL